MHFLFKLAFIFTVSIASANRRKEIFRTFNLISADYNIVCLYTNEIFKSSDFKESIGSLVNPSCNIHVYSYSLLDYDEYGSFSFNDPFQLKREMEMMKVFTDSIRQKSIKESRVLATIGKPNLKLNEFLLVAGFINYTQFANDAVDFYTSNDFDGLNFQFKITDSDLKTNETAELLKNFITNLKSELFAVTMVYKLPVLQLSFTLHFDTWTAFAGIDVFSEFFKIFDFVNIVPFKIENPFDVKNRKPSTTKFYLPLFSNNQDEMTFSRIVDETLKLNIARHKIVFAIPFFGKSQKLKEYALNKVGDPTLGLGKPGKFTHKSGFLSYGEICYNIERYGARIRTWNDTCLVPYLHFSDQWVSYEDEESLMQKIRYSKCNGIRGTMLYAVDFDDYKNQCKKNATDYPALQAIAIKELLNDDWQVCKPLISKRFNHTNRHMELFGANKSSLHYKMAKQPIATTVPPKELPPLTGPEVCSLVENNNRFSSEAKDCRVFYHCHDLKAVKRLCPYNLAFNNKISVCDFKANVVNCH